MAKLSNVATRIFYDQYDLSGYLNASDQNVEQEGLVTTTFADVGPRRIPGNYDVKHSDMGLFDPVAGAIDDTLFAALAATGDHYLTKLFGANAEGSVAYDSVVRLEGQPRSAQIGGVQLLKFDSAGSNGVARGLVLGNKTSTGAEDLTGRNMGVTTSGQIFAVVFRLITFSGTNIVLKIQGSSDDAAGDPYGDISGLTSGTLTAAGVVRATTTSATEAWKRLNISTPGGFTSAVILVTAGTVAA